MVRRHVLLRGLQLVEPINDVPVVLVIPSCWSRSIRLQILRLMLEKIGVGGVYFGEATLMAAFGCATPTALVVDIGHSITEVAAIAEGEQLPGVYECISCGGRDIDESLARFLETDFIFQNSLKGHEEFFKGEGRLEMARRLKESKAMSDEARVALGKTTMMSDKTAMISGEFKTTSSSSEESKITSLEEFKTAPSTFTFKNVEFQVGPERFQTLNTLIITLVDTMKSILYRSDADKRVQLLDHVILTGCTSRLPLRPILESSLRTHLVVSEFCGESQSRNLHIRSVPEYYPDLWQRATPLSAWFGAGITAKCVLSDSKNYYTREDLLQHGNRIFTNK
jgi:actin-related protein